MNGTPLERYGIIERRGNPRGRGWLYRLTPAGRELQGVCDALGTWGARWLDVAPKNLDPGIVLWAVAKTMDPKRSPDGEWSSASMYATRQSTGSGFLSSVPSPSSAGSTPDSRRIS